MKIISLLSVILGHITVFIIIFIAYILFILIGILFKDKLPVALLKMIQISDEQRIKQVEKILGKYRDSVKKGNFRVTVKCIGIVFCVNSSGIFQNIIFSALLLPLLFLFWYAPITQGIAFAKIKGSTPFSVIAYYFIGGLEWILNPLSFFAGIVFTSSIISALINGKYIDFLLIISEIASIFITSVVVLFFQAILELLYVRKVLLSGGTANPLKPY